MFDGFRLDFSMIFDHVVIFYGFLDEFKFVVVLLAF